MALAKLRLLFLLLPLVAVLICCPRYASCSPTSCTVDLFQGAEVKYERVMRPRDFSLNPEHVYKLSSSVNIFMVNGSRYVYKPSSSFYGDSPEAEVLATLLDELMHLGVRPPRGIGTTVEFVSFLDPVQMIQAAERDGRGFHVAASLSPACSPCDMAHFKFLIMKHLDNIQNFRPGPGTLFNFFSSKGKRFPMLDTNRTQWLITPTAHIVLLDTLLSFSDARQGQNCFIDRDTGKFWAIDFDSCGFLTRKKDTYTLSMSILKCIQNNMLRYNHRGLACDVLQALHRKVSESPSLFDALYHRMKSSPYWAFDCPFAAMTLSAGRGLPFSYPLSQQGCLAAQFGDHILTTDYVQHADFPWHAVRIVHTHPSGQRSCLVDRAMVLAFVLDVRLKVIRQMVQDEEERRNCRPASP